MNKDTMQENSAETVRNPEIKKRDVQFTEGQKKMLEKHPGLARYFDYENHKPANDDAKKIEKGTATLQGIGVEEVEPISQIRPTLRSEMMSANAHIPIESTTVADSMETKVEETMGEHYEAGRDMATSTIDTPPSSAEQRMQAMGDRVDDMLALEDIQVEEAINGIEEKAIQIRNQEQKDEWPTLEVVNTEEPVVVESMKQTLEGVGENLPLEKNKSSHSESIKATLQGTGEQVQQKSTLKMGIKNPEDKLTADITEAERRKKFALDEPVELPMDTLSSVYNQKMDELDTDIVNMGRNLMEVGVMLGVGSARASEHIAKKSETENKKLDNVDNPDKVKRGDFLNKEMGKIKADSIKMGNELRVLNGIQIKDRTPAHIMRMKQLELSLLRNSILMELVTLNIKDMNGDASARKKMKEGAGKLKKTVDALKNLRVIPIQAPAQKSKSVAQGLIEYGTPYQGEKKPGVLKKAWGGIKYFFTGKESGH